MVYTNLHMHWHMVTILYTQQCIQSPTVVQHTRYILYRSKHRVHSEAYTVYTGTSTLLYTDLNYTGPYTVGQYEQAYTQVTNMNRYRPYTCRLYRLYMHRVYYTHLYTVNTGQYTGLQYTCWSTIHKYLSLYKQGVTYTNLYITYGSLHSLHYTQVYTSGLLSTRVYIWLQGYTRMYTGFTQATYI